MRALRWTVSILIGGVIIILLIGFIAPKNVTIRGNATIKAPVDIVFNQINDLKEWPKWFPFEDADTTAEIQAHGPESGVGAQMLWQSQKYGSGMAIITGTEKDKWINMLIDLIGNDIATSKWVFEPQGDETNVTWIVNIKGLSYPIGRIKGLFYNSNMQPYFKTSFEKLDEISLAAADSTRKSQQQVPAK